MKLQHEFDRGPGQCVLVNGTKYELDADGTVEVSEADAAKLQLSPRWQAPEYWAGRKSKMAAVTPLTLPSGARRVRTQDELRQAASISGTPVAEPEPEAKPEVEVSDSMKKGELIALAEQVGLELTPGMTKAEILDLFEKGQ